MGLGVEGAIGNLEMFGIARTFRVVSTHANRAHARCKGCGGELAKGEGREVQVQGIRVGQTSFAYFCACCFLVIWAANTAFPAIDAAELSGLEMAQPVSTGVVGDEELERALAVREAQCRIEKT